MVSSKKSIRTQIRPRGGVALLLAGAGAVALASLALAPRPGGSALLPLVEPSPTVILPTESPAPESPPEETIPTRNASPKAEQELARKINRLVRGADLGKGRVSISVRACDDGDGPGREVVAINADRASKPASNMKVISTGAALHQLGPDFEFETRVVAVDDAWTIEIEQVELS